MVHLSILKKGDRERQREIGRSHVFTSWTCAYRSEEQTPETAGRSLGHPLSAIHVLKGSTRTRLAATLAKGLFGLARVSTFLGLFKLKSSEFSSKLVYLQVLHDISSIIKYRYTMAHGGKANGPWNRNLPCSACFVYGSLVVLVHTMF